MKREMLNFEKRMLTVLAAAFIALLSAGFAPVSVPAEVPAVSENAEEEETGRKTLTITVVEDLPATEIEDEEIPLAAMPAASSDSGLRHLVWMAVLLAAVIAYICYFGNYDRKLSRLRREAAAAELQMMRSVRERGGRNSGRTNI